jgi:hypothetical protein
MKNILEPTLAEATNHASLFGPGDRVSVNFGPRPFAAIVVESRRGEMTVQDERGQTFVVHPHAAEKL